MQFYAQQGTVFIQGPKRLEKTLETWKTIDGFPKYNISDLGRIQNNTTDRYIIPKINQYGVVGVGFMKDGQQYHRSVPLLVALAFIVRPSPVFDTPINLDGDRMNNAVSNLLWRPRWFAREYNRQFKERYESHIDKPIKDLGTGIKYPNSFDVFTRFGLLERDIVLSIVNRTFVWPTYQQFGLV